jgi:hypothetical protein
MVAKNTKKIPTPRDPGPIETGKATPTIVSKLLKKHRSLAITGDSPFSDMSAPFVKEMTAEECKILLMGFVEMYPKKIITRNFFRNNSGISESTWNRYFGTFEEFKRAAKVKLSRHVHRLEKDIAKHSSVDHYRALNSDRLNYEGRYEKDQSGRFITMMISSDHHDTECDPFALRVWLDAIRRVQPETIVYAGDLFDLPEFGMYPVDPRDWDVVGRIKFAHENILTPTRTLAQDANIHIIEGNHENRILRHLADGTQAMRVILSDLHGMTLSSLLKLDELEINYTARADLAAWTKKDRGNELRRNWRIFHDCVLVHHFREGMSKGMPGCHGHSHKHLTWSLDSPLFGAYEWHQLGCMHIRDAVYTDAEKWSIGFAIVHLDTQTKYTNWEYISVTDQAIVGGQRYLRTPEEKVVNHAEKSPKQFLR